MSAVDTFQIVPFSTFKLEIDSVFNLVMCLNFNFTKLQIFKKKFPKFAKFPKFYEKNFVRL